MASNFEEYKAFTRKLGTERNETKIEVLRLHLQAGRRINAPPETMQNRTIPIAQVHEASKVDEASII